VLGLTLTGESINDLADPRLRGRRAAPAEDLMAEGATSEEAES